MNGLWPGFPADTSPLGTSGPEYGYAAGSDPARKSALEKSLGTLVGMLEQMAPEVDREKRDEVDTRDYLALLEQTYAEAGGKLKTARSDLERAQRDMARAAQQREQADRQAEAARRRPGSPARRAV